MLAKTNLDKVEVLISKVLVDSFISRNEFVMINKNLLKEYDDITDKINNLKPSSFN